MRLLKCTDILIKGMHLLQNRFNGISNKYYGPVYRNASQLEKQDQSVYVLNSGSYQLSLDESQPERQEPAADINSWKTRIIRYVSRRELDLQYEPLIPGQEESLKQKIKTAATKLSSYIIIAIATCLFPITLKLGMRIKSAAVTLCKYFLLIIAACFLPITLALDSIDFAAQAIVEIAKAAVLIFKTITSPMPTAKVSNNKPENAQAVDKRNDDDTYSEPSSPSITHLRDSSNSNDGFDINPENAEEHESDENLEAKGSPRMDIV